MIIPSIDILGGQAVQLVGGREKALEAGDPLLIAEKYSVVGELAVIDLDAALGRGSNREIVRELVGRFPCRVGGGIRSVGQALEWLDQGARQVILGTAATPEVLSQLPRERTMAALDGVEGELVVEGWQRSTGKRVVDQIRDLRGLVGGFLVTFVEKEGRLGGSDMSAARTVVDLAGDVSVTVAGGISTTEEVADLDRLGADAQVGMALYTDHLDLADAFTAPLVSDRPDGLWPTVVADELGTTLGLVYSSAASVRAAVASRRGVYWSRSRGLWEKGATSGATQRLIRAQADCDRDSLLFTVCQEGGGFCHRETRSCFGGDRGFGALERRLSQRLAGESSRSLTKKLIQDSAFLEAKLLEEAAELADAGSTEEVIWEAADLLYFAAVALRRRGVGFADVAAELDRRALAVRRRDGSSTYAGGSQ